LVGDSVGGNYKRETYFLSGGTSLKIENWELGIRANYKGSVSYRQVDPRPRNTVSVFSIHPGIIYRTETGIMVGRVNTCATAKM
jgi:hypothetical protein